MANAGDLLSDDSGEDQTTAGDVLHPDCDVFTISPGKYEALVAKGTSARITSVRIYKRTRNGGPKERIPGHLDPAVVSTERILKKYGPGVYEFHGLNEHRQFLTSSTIHLAHGYEESDEEPEDDLPDIPEMPEPQPMAAPAGVDPMFAFMMQQQQQQNQMMMQLFSTMVTRPASGGGMSELAESIAASTAANNQSLQGLSATMAANFAAQAASPGSQVAAQQNSMLEKVVLAAMSREPAQPSPQQNVSELLLVLSQMKDDDESGGSKLFWTEIFPTLVDGLGAPVLGAVAAAMPKEKGQILSELLQQHMRTREAEANADASNVVETAGEIV